jgi:hypothetical protein
MYAVLIAVLFSLLVYYLFLGRSTLPEGLPSAEASTRFLQHTKNLTTQEEAINTTYIHVHKNARLLKNTGRNNCSIIHKHAWKEEFAWRYNL